MNGQSVTTPSGEIWTVRRCWLAKRSVRWQGRNPLRRRSAGDRRRDSGSNGDRSDWRDGLEVFDLADADNPFAALAVVAVVVVVALLGWLLLVPLVLAIIDLTLLVLLTAAGIAARTLLRRPWEIEALAPDGRRLTWRVAGWRRSRRTMADITARLRQGHVPADSTDFPPA